MNIGAFHKKTRRYLDMRLGFSEEQIRIIKEEYTFAYEAFRRHYYKTKGLETMLGKISPEANAEEVKRSMDMFVKLTLSDNFRDLYDFFDDENIFTSLLTHARENPIGFTATIIANGNFYNSDPGAIEMGKAMGHSPELIEVPLADEGVNLRVKTERHMFLKAFELLNDNLSLTK